MAAKAKTTVVAPQDTPSTQVAETAADAAPAAETPAVEKAVGLTVREATAACLAEHFPADLVESVLGKVSEHLEHNLVATISGPKDAPILELHSLDFGNAYTEQALEAKYGVNRPIVINSCIADKLG